MDDLSSELLKDLVCPVDQLPLVRSGEELVCAAGHRYPVVQGVPVLLRSDVEQTIGIAMRSLRWIASSGSVCSRAFVISMTRPVDY